MTVCVCLSVRQHRMSVCVCVSLSVHLGGREQELEKAISSSGRGGVDGAWVRQRQQLKHVSVGVHSVHEHFVSRLGVCVVKHLCVGSLCAILCLGAM